MAGRTLYLTDLDEAEKERRIRCSANLRSVCYVVTDDVPDPITGPFEEVRVKARAKLVSMFRKLGSSLLWIAPSLAVTPNYYISDPWIYKELQIIGDADFKSAEDFERQRLDDARFMELMSEVYTGGDIQALDPVPKGNENDIWKQNVKVTFGYDLLMIVPAYGEGVRGLVKNGLLEGIVRTAAERKTSKAPTDMTSASDTVEICLGRITAADVDFVRNTGTIRFTPADDLVDDVTITFPLDSEYEEYEDKVKQELNKMFLDDMSKEQKEQKEE